MKPIFSFRSFIILGGPLVSSLSLYLILSSLLLFPSDITVALSVILFSLLFGLSSYLLLGRDENGSRQNDHINENNTDTDANGVRHINVARIKKNSASNLIFISVYIISLIIVATSKPLDNTEELFIAWNQLSMSPMQIMQLAGAFLLSFLFPGYAIVYLLLKGNRFRSLPMVLLSFLFSMLIVGFIVYVVAIIGTTADYVNPIIIGVDISILILFIVYNKTKKRLLFNLDAVRSFFQSGPKFWKKVTTENIALFIIFASLFSLIIFYTYYIEKGVIVGDQWFHNGRALLINSGTFNEFAMSGEGKYNPPFFSALLAGFFSLSGVPSVNAYVSLNVLNMMAIFAFYYFFSRWVPSNQRKAVVLATTLFVLSSGFGWVLVFNSSLTNSYHSEESSLENLHLASIRSSDIRTPNTFINVGHPTFTSPLIIIGLPAGFVLLGLMHEHWTKQPKLRFICIITAITVLGILSHPEFYLFIIIGSILILSFRLSYGNLIYASFLLSVFFCIIVDFLSPLNYYSAITILNAPLLVLCLVFVSILWGLYETKILSKVYVLKSLGHSFPFPKFVSPTSKSAIRIAIISVLAYFYLFTFIVLQALSIDDIQIQVGTSTQRNIPWYLYPMKFGVVGLLGLAFIASYLFKRFEKELFIFGIIAVVALIAGPYYDEHRFSKYIMVGMVGFASLLVYRIILFLQRPNNEPRQQSRYTASQLKLLVSGVLIGLVITSAGLSVFMLAGYKALGYNNLLFQEDFFRINFPSQSEMNLLNFFRSDLPNLKTYFIAIQANESQSEDLFSKILGFSAIPRSRILQNPQSLNASTLEGLYSSLHNDNIKYILLLKSDANSEEQIQKPLRFALDNFPRVYQDDAYIVIEVPDFVSPLSQRAVGTGLVYDKRNELPPLSVISNATNNSSSAILQYNYKFFNNIENGSKFLEIEKKSNDSGNKGKFDETEILTLHGDEKPRTLWSSAIKEPSNVNYIEGKFRLVAENRTRNDIGIRMEDETNSHQYYVSLDKDSLSLRQKSLLENISNKERVLSQNQIPTEQRGLWHSLKVLVLKDTINVYLDDILKIKAPKFPLAQNFSSISKIGITANKNIGQFEPLKIGYLSESTLDSFQKSNMRDTYYHHYYPLSALALSKLPYDTFIDGDFSVLSKRNVILTSDPRLEIEGKEAKAVEESGAQDKHVISGEQFKKYLDYVKSGGTIIVMFPDSSSYKSTNDSNKSELGAFSNLLSLRYGDKVKFNGIVSSSEQIPVNKSSPEHHYFINDSGIATNIEFGNSSDIDVRSNYVDVDKDNKSNYKIVAPFAIEKKYGQGKLVLVNIAGYFDSLYKSNNQAFTTIYDIPKLIELESDAHYVTPPKGSKIFANARIIGDMRISNYTYVTIKSNALLFNSIVGGSLPYNLTIDNISASPLMRIYSNNSNDNGSLQQQYINENSSKNLNNVFSNITIKDLKLYGPYEVIINSTNSFFHMSPASSYYDYIAAAIPKGFDMLLNLSQGAYAEFTILSCTNNSYCQPQQIRISGDDVDFHNIEVDTPSISSIPVYVKSPQIMINNGTAEFKLDSNSNNPLQPAGNILATGNIVENIDSVETYNSFNQNGTKSDSIIYLRSLDIQGNYVIENIESDTLRLPGDLSDRAKDKGIGVPWLTTMMSLTSIIIMISVTGILIVVKYYFLPKIKHYREL